MRELESIMRRDELAVFDLRALYLGRGYAHYRMSKFEEYELYLRNKDFLPSGGVITFTDATGRLLALKPDVTLSIIRNTRDGEGVQKLCYNESVYRASEGSRDFREITQTGLECIGEVGAEETREVVELALESLKLISPDYLLDLSDLGFISALADETGIDGALRREIMACVGRKSADGIRSLCEKNGLPEEAAKKLTLLVDAYGPADGVIERLGAAGLGAAATAALEAFAEVCRPLNSGKYAGHLNVDFSLTGDMRYYSGVVFRGYIRGVPTGVLSGGRYDTLMRRMGRSAGAIGFAVYLDRLERLPSNGRGGDGIG